MTIGLELHCCVLGGQASNDSTLRREGSIPQMARAQLAPAKEGLANLSPLSAVQGSHLPAQHPANSATLPQDDEQRFSVASPSAISRASLVQTFDCGE